MAFHRSHGGRNREIDASGHSCYAPLTSTSSFHPKRHNSLICCLQRLLSSVNVYLMPRFDVICNVYLSLAMIFPQGKAKAKLWPSFSKATLTSRGESGIRGDASTRGSARMTKESYRKGKASEVWMKLQSGRSGTSLRRPCFGDDARPDLPLASLPRPVWARPRPTTPCFSASLVPLY